MVEQVTARYPAPLPVALMLCGLLTACGDRIPGPSGAPGTATPTPAPSNPSPAVTNAGFLHVLQHPWVMTYQIDPSGRLRPPVTQRLGNDLNALADEPQGRFVYGARGGWSLSWGEGGGSDPKIVTYAPDPGDGTLSQVSEISIGQHPEYTCCFDQGAWIWLKGGEHRVHGLWVHSWWTGRRPHVTYSYFHVGVANDGQLGPVSQSVIDYAEDDPGQVLVDVRADALYKAGNPYFPIGANRLGGMEAQVIKPDGTLDWMGWTNLCLATTLSYDFLTPLVTARGFLFASFNNNGTPTVCAYQGLRLKPLYALDLEASAAAAFVPNSEGEPALLAMSVTIPTGGTSRRELRLFAMNGDGGIRPLASEELPDTMKQLLFHPSGRFLYGVDAGVGLRAYTVESDGRLKLTMTIDHGGGSMAITLKDAQAEDR